MAEMLLRQNWDLIFGQVFKVNADTGILVSCLPSGPYLFSKATLGIMPLYGRRGITVDARFLQMILEPQTGRI